MTWEDALETVVAATKHGRYRVLCADDHPDREIHRALVLELATGVARPSPSYPSIASQAAGAAAALGRVLSAFAGGEPVLAPPGRVEERKAICRACPYHDPAQDRCTVCGCGGLKLHLVTERCPLDPPRW